MTSSPVIQPLLGRVAGRRLGWLQEFVLRLQLLFYSSQHSSKISFLRKLTPVLLGLLFTGAVIQFVVNFQHGAVGTTREVVAVQCGSLLLVGFAQ